jgi:pimeloyl-ACP methyl ester carboxylesterase
MVGLLMAARPEPKDLEHHRVDVSPGTALHAVIAGAGPHTVVLVHGYPQTWRVWRDVIPPLLKAGLRVLAVDYRGAGESSKPEAGYDKRTMAADIRTVIHRLLGPSAPFTWVGHDIGLMVGVASALQYRDQAAGLVIIDAPIPGTAGFEALRCDPRLWHFAFHAAAGFPEMLTSGRERDYIAAFIRARLNRPDLIPDDELNGYIAAYSQPHAMRAGFELYRAFDEDSAFVRSELLTGGKLRTPVLAISGGASLSSSYMSGMAAELSVNTNTVILPGVGHWIPEEAPEQLAGLIAGFVNRMRPSGGPE